MGRKKGSSKSPYSMPPETEVRLQELQAQFRADRNNKEVLHEFFSLIRVYARSLALKEIKRNNIYLAPERVDEISTDATLAVFKQYEKPEWSIESSFAGILYWKIREAMYSQAKDEQVYSLNAKFDADDSESKEILDIVGSNVGLPWQVGMTAFADSADRPEEELIQSINVAYDEIEEIIEQAYDMLPYPTFIKFLPWLVLRFRKPRARNCYSTFDRLFLTNKEENAFEILFLEVHDRIASHI